ncbi:MaoC-like dehydratase [Novosphingobium resinovorum]|uniref:MaoC-like dehydratase n=1 Tax=Novosphingobium resinovorum TaxID=158500 RepID=A0A031JSK3_9SPHN|nr:MaoC family dehydratase [Novosphingobium resinovorum]EZP79327.1 MaoC-like dehydratase [Novosphingobium resinovorum]
MTSSAANSATVGFRLPERRYLVSQQLIRRYAEVSGDHNPLHLDPEFAKTTKFGCIIAHGMMTLAFVSQVMRDWAGPAWEDLGELAVTFVAPVYAEDEVVVRAEVKECAPGMRLCKVECWVGDRLTLTGEAGIRGEIAHG